MARACVHFLSSPRHLWLNFVFIIIGKPVIEWKLFSFRPERWKGSHLTPRAWLGQTEITGSLKQLKIDLTFLLFKADISKWLKWKCSSAPTYQQLGCLRVHLILETNLVRIRIPSQLSYFMFSSQDDLENLYE